MSTPLLQRIDRLRVGEPLVHASLTVFPIVGPRDGEVSYDLLQDALESGSLEVCEQGSALVNSLLAINSGTLPVLILDGEELVGGKQNRMVNSSVLIPKGRAILPVSCVEQGRWHDVAPSFTTREASYPSLRREKTEQVQRSLHMAGAHRTDQSRVWENIRERQQEESVRSDTGAMADIYANKRESLESFERALPYQQGAVGMAVAIGGRMISADLFDCPATMQKLWRKLIRASAMDAVSVPVGKPVSRSRAERMLQRVRDASLEIFPSPGLGEDVRVHGGGVVGSALVYDGTVVHAALFRTHGNTRGGSRMASQSVRRSLRDA